MEIKYSEDLDKEKNKVPNDNQITPNLVQSMIIFICFVGLTWCLMALTIAQ